GKYIKDWDANVTQKFQEYSEKLKPWESLGVEYDSARAAVQAMMFAEQDPVTFHQLLTEQLKELELLPGENPVGTETQGSPLPEFEGLNEGFVNRFTKLEENLNKVGEFMDNYNKENTRKSQEQMLDETLKALE